MKKENSSNAINQRRVNDVCGTAYTLTIVGGRWKSTLIHLLAYRKMRFVDFKNLIPGISDRMLSLQLKELEKDGIISRQLFSEIPPRVEYTLTKAGIDIELSLKHLSEWGKKYKQLSQSKTKRLQPSSFTVK